MRLIDISLNLSYFINLIVNWTTNHNLWSFLWIFPWSYPWSLIISLTLHHRMKRWLRIDQVRNIKRWLQLQLLLIPLPTRSSIAVFLILHYISSLFYYFYRLLLLLRRIFEKIQRLKKHRILAGLIHFSRLKLAFFKKVAFLPTQAKYQWSF